jgi:hypothetical protein
MARGSDHLRFTNHDLRFKWHKLQSEQAASDSLLGFTIYDSRFKWHRLQSVTAIYDLRFTIYDSRTRAEVAELADAHV